MATKQENVVSLNMEVVDVALEEFRTLIQWLKPIKRQGGAGYPWLMTEIAVVFYKLNDFSKNNKRNNLLTICKNESRMKKKRACGFLGFTAYSAYCNTKIWDSKDVEINAMDMLQNQDKSKTEKFKIYKFFRNMLYGQTDVMSNTGFYPQDQNNRTLDVEEMLSMGISDHEELFPDKYYRQISSDTADNTRTRKISVPMMFY